MAPIIIPFQAVITLSSVPGRVRSSRAQGAFPSGGQACPELLGSHRKLLRDFFDTFDRVGDAGALKVALFGNIEDGAKNFSVFGIENFFESAKGSIRKIYPLHLQVRIQRW